MSISKSKLVIALGIATLLTGCGSDTYTFDKDNYLNDTKSYVLSEGKGHELGCKFVSVLFAKEALERVKAGKKPDIKNLKDGFTPTTIEVSSDSINWIDLGQESRIENDIVKMSGVNNNEFAFQVIRENDTFELIYEGKFTCRIPFKKQA